MMQYKGNTGVVQYDNETKIFATRSDKSMNAWVKETLEHAAEHEMETA
ncbi:MAG: hypothetical protein ACR2MQ_00730 [Gemmatimonadaceae bacterium]